MSDSTCEVTERLFAEFDCVHTLPAIAAAVLRARHDLQGSPKPALPELVERLARYRLAEAARRDQATATRDVTGTTTMAQAV